MYNDYFDFPAEPSTGDIVFEELKKILLGTLKEEIKTELETLRAENAELRPYKEERERMRLTLLRTQQECERKVRDAEKKARAMALEELFGDCVVDAWMVGRDYKQGPKCDKCDEKRKLHYTTPRGRAMTEDCECAECSVKYFPKPAIMSRFQIHPKASVSAQDKDTYPRPVYRWYTTQYETVEDGAEFVVDSDNEIGSSRFADREDTSFEKLNEWRDVFTSKERCQAFCEYLAEKDTKSKNKNS
jgi:hypothetical protein